MQRQPPFELVRSVIQEYHHSHIVGNSPDRKGTETDFRTLNWGERFINTHKQITSILKNEKRTLSNKLPNLRRLKVFMSA
ncbi:MAG TPA: hypothetical protein VMN99_11030, partial [Anaerolineales bacterium]|nr:hypothetical protein [Anaerolineales bacterium]